MRSARKANSRLGPASKNRPAKPGGFYFAKSGIGLPAASIIMASSADIGLQRASLTARWWFHAELGRRDGRLHVRWIDLLVEIGVQLLPIEFTFPPRHEHRGDAVAGNVGERA